MATDLSMEDRKLLMAWGVWVKELLYKASRDGCSPAAFHQQCDNRGPTLTLLHNTSGYVFGGCTFANWNSSGSWINDPKAFLFRLKEKGNVAPVKLPVTQPKSAANCNPTLGPAFGGGYDLLVFSGQTFNRVNNSYFQLNGQCNIGNSYNASDLTVATFTGNDFKMTEIQVFSMEEYRGQTLQEEEGGARLLEKPWRAVSRDSLQTLKEAVQAYRPVEAVQVERTNLLLLGPVGSGKSSFFNTVSSVFRGYVTSQASSGSAEHSVTSTFRTYEVRDRKTGEKLKFRLCDSMGMEESQGLHANDIAAILEGHVRDKYQFNPIAPISPETLGYRKSPTLSDRMHCVVFVLDACALDVLPEKILNRIHEVRNLAFTKSLPQAVLLTKVDKLCPLTAEDAGNAFRSSLVQEAVEQAAKLVGLPRGHVLPLRNYENETELDEAVSKMALDALRVLLRFADDFLFNQLDGEN